MAGNPAVNACSLGTVEGIRESEIYGGLMASFIKANNEPFDWLLLVLEWTAIAIVLLP